MIIQSEFWSPLGHSKCEYDEHAQHSAHEIIVSRRGDMTKEVEIETAEMLKARYLWSHFIVNILLSSGKSYKWSSSILI